MTRDPSGGIKRLHLPLPLRPHRAPVPLNGTRLLMNGRLESRDLSG